ncbi:MAG: hypothetical protein ACD_80C00152G0004 [uncultured bacterium (gcode 4)]|uniref:Glycosyltransferase RgtA/B/C/D-like domain-containing protein n=1 Tax=uncultured bacterium (gcode 4) TaxID=1234023 RepID=K1X3X9_9BACT|nr:MAG: hypothetical protein ACD_80C00152G0004 [uncultured bacterium (gcode 4)]
MFETWFLLLIKALLYNIVLPLIPGILFLWIFFGKKINGMLLYLLWWFIGAGVVAFSLFNLQFIHFWIGIGEYFLVLWLLIVIFVGILLYKKSSFKEYIPTLKIKNIFPQIKESFLGLSKIEKIFTWVGWISWIFLLIITFLHVTHFPTYADDSFQNWNGPAYNIYQDGGVKMFWEKTEILGRWRLGYPIYIPMYKATISKFLWGFNDIYINLWQWLVFFGMLLFIFTITFAKTKNIFHSILPIGLIAWLPLLFFHTSEGYMELPCAVYSILTIRAFWKFLEEKEYTYISLALLFWFMLSHIKNDWLLWYFAGILIAFVCILVVSKTLSSFVQWFLKDKPAILSSLFYFFFFLLPFLIVRSINNLWFNPVATNEWWIWFSQTTHWEIFSVFPSIFMKMDNYNVILIVLLLLGWFLYTQKKNFNKYFLALSWSVIFIVFVLVFLFTENYAFVMNQTTVNRVFTMCFLIILSFSGILLHNHHDE